jgi:hypothetical protein
MSREQVAPAPTGTSRDVGAAVLAVAVTGALTLLGVSLLGVVLGGLGWWRPVVVWPLVAVLLVAVALLARRLAPGLAPRLTVAPAAAFALVVVAVTVWLGATHADQVLPRRDAGSNLQAAISLATEHRRIVPVDVAAIGGAKTLEREGIRLGSPAFYQVGGTSDAAIQPQFPVGPAAVYSLGWWAGGNPGAQWLAPISLAIALLGLGLLAARWAGAWAAAPVAALTGVTFPVVHVSRSTYSEPIALATLVVGVLLLSAAAGGHTPEGMTRRAALLGGVLVGGTILVRADGLREVVLATVGCALLLVRGHRAAAGPFLVGAWVSTLLSYAALLWLSPRYLGDIAGSLVPLVAIAVAVAVGTALVVAVARRGVGLPHGIRRLLPALAFLGSLALGAYLWSRPFWQVTRQSPDDPGARVVAGLQLAQGLTVDGGRTYAEQTVAWLVWWVGPVALVVTTLACAVWARRLAREWNAGERLAEWTVPMVVAIGSLVLTLLRPGITPDHPWAERRLVIGIAAVCLVVVVASVDLLLRAAHRWSPAVGALPGLFVLVATTVVAARGTLPHATERIEQGSTATVAAVCAALRPGDVVVAVDSRAVNEWPQVVRGECRHPALVTTGALRNDPAALRSTLAGIAADLPPGSRLVALAADGPESLGEALGPSAGASRPVGVRVVREDQRLLEAIPTSTDPLTIGAWLAPVGP